MTESSANIATLALLRTSNVSWVKIEKSWNALVVEWLEYMPHDHSVPGLNLFILPSLKGV